MKSVWTVFLILGLASPRPFASSWSPIKSGPLIRVLNRQGQNENNVFGTTHFPLNLSGGGGGEELQDYSGKAASLFGDIRIPAALFAGASAGAAFAMPLTGADGVKFGFAKRVYALLMMGGLSCEMIAIVTATLAMAGIANQSRPVLSKCANSYLDAEYNFEWVAARLHFLLGILMFASGAGLRAWVTIGCPIYAKASLGIISSATIFCLGIINARERCAGSSVFALPLKFLQLMLQKATSDFLFGLSFVLATATAAYVCANVPHVFHYLNS